MPAKKPPGRRQGRGTRDVGQLAVVNVDVPAAPHPPRRKLLACTVHAWTAFWGSELAGMVQAADGPALQRLFRMYDLRERMERAMLTEPFVEGSTGQLVVHPAAKEMASLDGRIKDLEDRFGLTPKARLHLGIAFGVAAKSLEDLNRDFDRDAQDDEDPRIRVLETQAR